MNDLGKYSSKCKGPETESVVVEKQYKDQWGQRVVSNRGLGGENVSGSQPRPASLALLQSISLLLPFP